MSRYPGSYDDNLSANHDQPSPHPGMPRPPLPPLNHPLPGSGSDPGSGAELDYELSETGSILSDLDGQSRNVERGLLAMPLDAARDSLLRWSSTLRSLADEKLDRVASTLDELRSALAAPKLEARRIGSLIARAGMDTRTVASERTGAIGMCLDRLADALIFAGNSLTHDA